MHHLNSVLLEGTAETEPMLDTIAPNLTVAIFRLSVRTVDQNGEPTVVGIRIQTTPKLADSVIATVREHAALRIVGRLASGYVIAEHVELRRVA